jgi:glycosyltransferase involved in cell wall biosynthesis
MASAKINVMHICDHLGWEGSRMHGVKRLFTYIFPRHDSERFNLSLVSLRQRDLSEERLEAYGINIYYLGKHKFNPRTYWALKKIVKKENAHILHMHGYGATTFGRLVGWFNRRATILHEHANLTGMYPGYLGPIDRLLAKHTDVAMAVGASTMEFTLKCRRTLPERTKLVYLGAPMEEFYPRGPEEIAANRRKFGIPEDHFVVGTVTRLHENKGNQYFVAAAKKILERHPKTIFPIVGEGPLEGELRAQAEELGIADKVQLWGFQGDVPAVMSTFDVMVYPSLWEGTPLTCFEAMGMGKTLASTRCDGLVQVLTEGETALMCGMRDADGLADIIVRLLENPALRERLGQAALKESEKYDIRNFVRFCESLYEDLYEKYFGGGRRK